MNIYLFFIQDNFILRRVANCYSPFNYPTIKSSISFAKVITIPPASVRKPLALWEGSWDWKESPTCTIPQPSMIIPIARIIPKIKVDKLLMTVSGSPSAKAIILNEKQSTTAVMAASILLSFCSALLKGVLCALSNFLIVLFLRFKFFFKFKLCQELIPVIGNRDLVNLVSRNVQH